MKKHLCKKNLQNPWILFTTNDYFLLESCQLYVIAKYKINGWSKIRDRLCQTRFLYPKSKKNKNSLRSSCFWLHLIAWAASILWENSCKTLCPQKNNCSRVYSYCNHSSLIFEAKVKIKTVYSDLYSTAEVFLYSRSDCFCDAFKLVSDWFRC